MPWLALCTRRRSVRTLPSRQTAALRPAGQSPTQLVECPVHCEQNREVERPVATCVVAEFCELWCASWRPRKDLDLRVSLLVKYGHREQRITGSAVRVKTTFAKYHAIVNVFGLHVATIAAADFRP